MRSRVISSRERTKGHIGLLQVGTSDFQRTFFDFKAYYRKICHRLYNINHITFKSIPSNSTAIANLSAAFSIKWGHIKYGLRNSVFLTDHLKAFSTGLEL